MGSAVVGPVGAGGTARSMPVEVGGIDGTGKLRTLKLDANGNLVLGGAVVEIGEVQLLGADGVTLVKVVNGALLTSPGAAAGTGAVTSPASVTGNGVTVLAANTNRLGAAVWNESGAACFIKLGSGGTTTSYTVNMAIGGYYELPFGYNGIITGSTASGTAVLRVTELTA